MTCFVKLGYLNNADISCCRSAFLSYKEIKIAWCALSWPAIVTFWPLRILQMPIFGFSKMKTIVIVKKMTFHLQSRCSSKQLRVLRYFLWKRLWSIWWCNCNLIRLSLCQIVKVHVQDGQANQQVENQTRGEVMKTILSQYRSLSRCVLQWSITVARHSEFGHVMFPSWDFFWGARRHWYVNVE